MNEPARLHPEILRLIEEFGESPSGPLRLYAAIYTLGLEHGNAIWAGMTDDRQRQLDEWKKAQDAKVARDQGNGHPYYGAIGGAYTYTYCATSIGTSVRVTNGVTGEVLDLTDYDEW